MTIWALPALVILSLAGQASPPAAAPTAPIRPETVQVGYLLNFANFGDWPQQKDTFTIGVVGKDPFGSDLDTLASRYKVRNSIPITIKRFANAKEVEGCQILFIANHAELDAVVAKTKKMPVLLVTKGEHLAEMGSMINFYLVENTGVTNVKFEINLNLIEESGIKLDARVIRLGKLIQSAPATSSETTLKSPSTD